MTTLFTNARLIDPEAKTETLGALLVKDGKIAEIYDDPDAYGNHMGIICNSYGKYLAPASSISASRSANPVSVTRKVSALQVWPPLPVASLQWSPAPTPCPPSTPRKFWNLSPAGPTKMPPCACYQCPP